MENLRVLVLGKNQQILETLERVFIKIKFVQTSFLSNENESYYFLKENKMDAILLSSGLSSEFEISIMNYAATNFPSIKVIPHYGGGSGLLRSEILINFPAYNF
jgi:hypothetical protein